MGCESPAVSRCGEQNQPLLWTGSRRGVIFLIRRFLWSVPPQNFIPSGTASMGTSPPSPFPSRADLLKDGGLNPIPVPLGWKLINTAGQEEEIPAIPEHPFHRILARGALLAMEGGHSDQRRVMMLRQYPLPGPLTPVLLDQYVTIVMGHLANSGFGPRLLTRRVTTCALSDEPCVKVVVDRTAPTDALSEFRYLVRDQTRQGWELVYLVHRENLGAWAPILAEIDGPTTTQPQT